MTENQMVNLSVSDIDNIIRPTITDYIKCDDIAKALREKNSQIASIFYTRESLSSLIRLMLESNDIGLTKKLLLIFEDVNCPYFNYFIESVDLIEQMTRSLDIVDKINPFIIGATTQILNYMLNYNQEKVIDVFNSSKIIYPRLIRCLDNPAVFYFCFRNSILDIKMQTFIWILYLSLMDEHGPGSPVPKGVSQNRASESEPPRLTPELRKKALEILFAFVNKYERDCSFLLDITDALPLMLQDASDDTERSLVFKVGIALYHNKALGYSALSVLTCLKSSNILIFSALYYIQIFEVYVKNSFLELLLFRLLHGKPNNFVLLALAKMLASVIKTSTESVALTEKLLMILASAFNNSKPKSYLLKAFKAALVSATNGIELDPISEECINRIVEFNNKPNICQIDIAYITELASKASKIDSDSVGFLPHFFVNKLVDKEQYSLLSKKFKTIERLSFLDNHSVGVRNERIYNIEKPLITPESIDEEDYEYEYENDSNGEYDVDYDFDDKENMRQSIERQRLAKLRENLVAPLSQSSNDAKNSEKLNHSISSSKGSVPQHLHAKTTNEYSEDRLYSDFLMEEYNSDSNHNVKPSVKEKKKSGKLRRVIKTDSSTQRRKTIKRSSKKKQNLVRKDSSDTDNYKTELPNQSNITFEFGVSTIRMKPRKQNVRINSSILVIDSPDRHGPTLSISDPQYMNLNFENNRIETKRREIQILLRTNNISTEEEDFEIKQLESENI